MKIYIIAGEASGDLHGASLISTIRQWEPNIKIRAWGGDKMKSAGSVLVKHYKDLAFMGFMEVVKNINTILNNLRFCKKDIEEFQPETLVLIDYPGFNLRIAKWAKKKGIKVVYYISPQIWAWHSSRVKKIKQSVDEMLVILPFEKSFYAEHNMNVKYVGHPLTEIRAKFIPDPDFKKKHQIEDRKTILLMPGSRKQEINRMLPIFAKTSKRFPNYQFLLAGINTIDRSLYEKHIASSSIKLIYDENYQLMSICDLAWISSGTATLEAAIFNLPQIVCYKGNPLSYQLAKRLVKVPFISLVNLIANQQIVTELIQEDFAVDALIDETQRLAQNAAEMRQQYNNHVVSKLSNLKTSELAAKIILNPRP